MFWSKKERAHGLPDLPPLTPSSSSVGNSESSDLSHDDEGSEKHTLPAFPDSPMQRGFSQAAIKDAVNQEDASVALVPPSFPEPPTYKPTMDFSQKFEPPPRQFDSSNSIPWASSLHAPPLSPPLPSPAPQFETLPRFRMHDEEQTQDIFVRLDKFYAARKALQTTREKLAEIDEMLRKIRETKMREEQELAAWEKQLADVKIRVQDVVQNIFEKIE